MVIERSYTTPNGQTYPRHYCDECGAEILNFMSSSPSWHCDHGPYGAARKRLSDRELLERIAADVAAIKAHVGL